MEFSVAELVQPLHDHGMSSDDLAVFAQISEAVGLIDPEPAGRAWATEDVWRSSSINDGENNAACEHDVETVGRGRYRCLVGHGESCALVGGPSPCCPPPASEDEHLWELIGDMVGRYSSIRRGAVIAQSAVSSLVF